MHDAVGAGLRPKQVLQDLGPRRRELIRCSCDSELFIRNYRAIGWWKQLVLFDAETKTPEIDSTNLADLRIKDEPKTMCCAQCGKRQPNPSYSEE